MSTPEPIRLLTTAPESYDGFGTLTTIQIVGWTLVAPPAPSFYGRIAARKENVREALVPSEAYAWQVCRYKSGLYLVLSREEWEAMLDDGRALEHCGDCEDSGFVERPTGRGMNDPDFRPGPCECRLGQLKALDLEAAEDADVNLRIDTKRDGDL